MSTMETPTQGIAPYLFFEGRCEEAIKFYHEALGAEVLRVARYKDIPEPPKPGDPPPPGDKIMHARLNIAGASLLLSDGHCSGKQDFGGFALSIGVRTEPEVDRYFNPLSEGGQVLMPPAKTFFSPRFAMVKDRFGVLWMILVERFMPG